MRESYYSLFKELLNFKFWNDFKQDWPLFRDDSLIAIGNEYWIARISNYANGYQNTSETAAQYGNLRVDYASHLMGVLDTKFSTLLQTLALFGLLIGVWARSTSAGVLPLSYLFWFVWLVTAICCFRGTFRVSWNEPADTVQNLHMDWEMNHPQLKEPLELKQLVRSLVRRTAWFRLSTVLTAGCILLGMLSVLIGITGG